MKMNKLAKASGAMLATGNYYYLSATCVESQQQVIPSRFPESPGNLLMITGNNSSQTPPWPQTN
jgi:hypothetical protein